MGHGLGDAQQARILGQIPVGDVWGVGPRLSARLAEHGIQSAAGYSDLAACILLKQPFTAELEACGVDVRMFDVKRFRN